MEFYSIDGNIFHHLRVSSFFFFFLITFTTFDLFFNVLCATFLGNQLNDPHNFVLNREIRNNLLYIASGL